MTKWEYKSISVESGGWMGGILKTEDFDQLLNQMGQQGWELVVVFDTNFNQGATRYVIATFKRASQT